MAKKAITFQMEKDTIKLIKKSAKARKQPAQVMVEQIVLTELNK